MAQDPEEANDTALQEMLGFTSFGAQNPKKRKFSGTVVAPPDDGGDCSVVRTTQRGGESGLPPRPADLPSRPADLPSRPPALTQQQQWHQQRQKQRWGRHGGEEREDEGEEEEAGRQRERRDPWWDGYYDPTSNENPWAELERRAGLGEKGSWLAKGHGYRTKG